MAVKLDFKEDIEVEEVMKEFYTTMGLTPEEASAKVKKFEEYIFRVKGVEPLRESLIDHIIDEMWFVGVWFALKHPELIDYNENVPEEPEPKVEQTTLKEIPDKDYNGMFG